MESTAKKTLDDLQKQAYIMITSGYSVTTTSHVLGVQPDILEKWIQPGKITLKTSGRKLTRKM
ncbi:MAG: hypothetical protein OEZ34_12180 [Spirochaetia bacterium]|nr:hypothetical protein [Spirochaetia bacterium]